MVYTMDSNAVFHAEIAKGARAEVNEELFDYYLEILPPVFMRRTVKLADGTTKGVMFAFAEGYDTPIAFWREGSKFFAQRVAS